MAGETVERLAEFEIVAATQADMMYWLTWLGFMSDGGSLQRFELRGLGFVTDDRKWHANFNMRGFEPIGGEGIDWNGD